MGLDVLESLCYALSLSCFEFSHLKRREFVKLILRISVLEIRELGVVIFVCCFVRL